jgi:hypothetical protein
MNKLQVKMVVFNDRIEIRCQIAIDPDITIHAILNLEISPFHKYHG